MNQGLSLGASARRFFCFQMSLISFFLTQKKKERKKERKRKKEREKKRKKRKEKKRKEKRKRNLKREIGLSPDSTSC